MKRILKTFGLLAFVILLVTKAPDALANTTQETVEQSLAFFLSLIIKMLNTFLWPFLILIGDLLDNDLIIGAGREDRLLAIWVQVRDLVNVFFVVILLITAFYNVTGFGSEGSFGFKTILPKLILGLVLVNFTFTIGKVVLDVTSVATTAAFALPEVANLDFGEQRESIRERLCEGQDSKWVGRNVNDKDISVATEIFCDTGGPILDAQGQAVLDENGAPDKYDDAELNGQLKPFIEATYFQDLNKSNVAVVMAVNMSFLEEQALLKAEAINDFSDLVVNGLFSMLMYIVFAISYVVLALVLIVRVVVIWIAMALSPLIVLIFVVPQIKDLAGGAGDIQGTVVKHLIAPITIGLVLSLGIMLLSQVGDTASGISSFSSVATQQVLDTELLLTGITDMEKFLMAITSIVIVWVGVFAAAEGTLASSVTGAIKGLGQRAAGLAARAPLYLPSVPIPTKGGEQQYVSPLAAGALFNEVERGLKYGIVNDDLKKISENADPGSFLGRVAGRGGITDPEDSAKEIMETFNSSSGNTISNEEAAKVAERIGNIVASSSDIDRSKRERIEAEVNRFRQSARNGTAGTGELRDLADFLEGEGVGDDVALTGGGWEDILEAMQQTKVKPNESNPAGGQPAQGAPQGDGGPPPPQRPPEPPPADGGGQASPPDGGTPPPDEGGT